MPVQILFYENISEFQNYFLFIYLQKTEALALSTVVLVLCVLYPILKGNLTFDPIITFKSEQLCRQVGNCLNNTTAAFWLYCMCADLWDKVAETSKQWCETTVRDTQMENDWENWESAMFVMTKNRWLCACQCPYELELLVLLCEYAWMCVQFSDSGTLSLPSFAADYWHYMACGGAPGKLLTPVPALHGF